MNRKNIQNTGQARLFENKYLEMLTKTNPFIIWGSYIPLLSYALYTAYETYLLPIKTIALLALAGIIYWTLFEYIAHRYIYHWISDNIKIQRAAYILHGNHHEFPRDPQRLIMPLVPSLIISSTLFGIHYLILRDYNWAFFPGFMLGYLLYASIHYAIHVYDPPFEFLKPLWRNHQMHHYRSERLGFGVSNTFWDRVFNTTFDLKKHEEEPDKSREIKFRRTS